MRTFRSEAIFAVSSSSIFTFEAGTGGQKIGGAGHGMSTGPNMTAIPPGGDPGGTSAAARTASAPLFQAGYQGIIL